MTFRRILVPSALAFALLLTIMWVLEVMLGTLSWWVIGLSGLVSAMFGQIVFYLLVDPVSYTTSFTLRSQKLDSVAPEPDTENIAVEQRMSELQSQFDELKMLRQFSAALNFTINYDAILWLIYTNCQEALDSCDFFIYLSDVQTSILYTAFHVENGERYPDREGIQSRVKNPRIRDYIELGQVIEHQDENGRYWLTAPLNAGADTVGALQSSHQQINVPFAEGQKDLFEKLAYRAATAIDHWQTNQTLQRRAQQLETLNELLHSINSELDVNALLELILDKAIELLEVEAGSFLLLDEDKNQLEFKVVRGPKSGDLLGTRLPIGRGIAGEVAQSGKPKLINNVSDDKTWFAQIDKDTDFHTEAMLTVPLMHQRKVLGVLQVVNRLNGVPFTNTDQFLLTAFAGEAAVALQNANLLQQTDQALQERVEELSMLQNIDRDLNTNLDVTHTLSTALGWLQKLYKASAVGVVIFDSDKEILSQQWQGYDAEFLLTPPSSIEDFTGLVGYTVETGQPQLTADVQQSPHYLAGRQATQAQMTIPVIHETNIIGVVVIESDEPQAYTQNDLDSAMSRINHITAAIANAQLYSQVEAANLAKSEFISIVSHELKTPLTSIRGFADLMLGGLTGEISDQQKEFMRTITNNVARMGRLIQDLTDVSRIDTGQLNVKVEPIPLTNVISETITSTQSLTTNKDIRIHLDLMNNPPMVMGDHSRLVQVMTNLISNACKYSPANTDVYVSLHTNGNDMMHCAVRDSGYGISPEDQAQLFTKFFRSSDANIRKAPGTGLGLSITRALIELHGGEMGFESAINEGTTFWFTVPQAAASEN